MLYKEIPFLRIVAPLCLGIIYGLLFNPGPLLFILLLSLTIAGFILSLLYNRQLANIPFGIVIFIAFFLCGLVLLRNEKNSITTLESVQTTFISTLSDYPVEKENTFMVTIRLNKAISGKGKRNVTGSLILYHRKDSVINTMLPGDILAISCTPVEIENRGNPYEFDYKSFMSSKGVRYYAFTGKQNILAHTSPDHRKLRYTALIIREKIINMYRERGIKGERLALVSAITLGQKNLLDNDQKQIFINAGIMHIMAVSGLHAIILSLFVFNLFFFLKGKLNILRICITITILWAFAFVTGLSPSVLRATLMFTFLQAGNLMNRKVNGINSVLASAFILIIIKPTVITDAGFLLSYAAVFYIIGFYQDLYLRLQFDRWLPDKIWQSAVVTLVAQAGTLPLTVMLFNRFPVYFIITNVVIVPLSSLLIVIGCLIPLTYPVVPVSEFLAAILDRLTGLTEFLTRTAASLPWSTVDKIGMTTVECIFLSIALTLMIIFILKKRPFSIRYPLAAFIVFASLICLKKVENGRADRLIVYNIPSYPAAGIQTGNTLHLICKKDSVPAEAMRHVATRGLKIKLIENGRKPVCLKAGNTTIIITDSLRSNWLKETKPDIIVLTGKRPYIERDISPSDLPETIIISSESAPGFRLPFPAGQMANKTIWYIRNSGTYFRGLRVS